MFDTAKVARDRGIKNVWVTCGYMQREPLAEFCRYLDAASVNLKSYSDDIYRDLNSGRLQPVLDTLKTLRREGVWFEVINLIVPTYTDKPDMIRTMCDWLVDNLGSDCPLHFSRFHPAHKLERLPPTPPDILIQARDIALQAGLRYVYIGNPPEPADAETTSCPKCKNLLVDRFRFTACVMGMSNGACKKCGTKIPGVWT
jgi:pyruvate formate lyase activating enzyme